MGVRLRMLNEALLRDCVIAFVKRTGRKMQRGRQQLSNFLDI